MAERTNGEWLCDLRGGGDGAAAAQADLCGVLRRGLRRALASRGDVDEATVEDFAQEAVVRVLGRLDGFRGDSRFTTWAVAVAVRVAFTELRRARWRDVSLDALAAGPGEVDPVDPAASPERQARQRAVLAALTRVLDEELTDRQRRAIRLELAGLPQDEVARLLETNRNALYKLVHDARRRLRAGLLKAGITEDDVRDGFDL